MKQNITQTLSIIGIIALMGFGCKSPEKPKTPEQIEAEKITTLPNYFLVDAQKPGQTVVIRETKFEKPGYMVIHESTEEETPGDILGYSEIVPRALKQNVKIALTILLEPDTQYIAMMHDDTDGDTFFDEKIDLPLLFLDSGSPITKKFGVKVEE